MNLLEIYYGVLKASELELDYHILKMTMKILKDLGGTASTTEILDYAVQQSQKNWDKVSHMLYLLAGEGVLTSELSKDGKKTIWKLI